jgi:hypothetical protein
MPGSCIAQLGADMHGVLQLLSYCNCGCSQCRQLRQVSAQVVLFHRCALHVGHEGAPGQLLRPVLPAAYMWCVTSSCLSHMELIYKPPAAVSRSQHMLVRHAGTCTGVGLAHTSKGV